jgi:hypothetical protein
MLIIGHSVRIDIWKTRAIKSANIIWSPRPFSPWQSKILRSDGTNATPTSNIFWYYFQISINKRCHLYKYKVQIFVNIKQNLWSIIFLQVLLVETLPQVLFNIDKYLDFVFIQMTPFVYWNLKIIPKDVWCLQCTVLLCVYLNSKTRL